MQGDFVKRANLRGLSLDLVLDGGEARLHVLAVGVVLVTLASRGLAFAEVEAKLATSFKLLANGSALLFEQLGEGGRFRAGANLQLAARLVGKAVCLGFDDRPKGCKISGGAIGESKLFFER